MRRPKKSTCGTCKHYHPTPVDEGQPPQGFCRRFPPTVFLTPDGNTRSAFAPVRGDFVCGEFVDKR